MKNSALVQNTDQPANLSFLGTSISYPSLVALPEITYRKENALSQSVLKKMGEHPRAAQLYETHGMEPTPAMIFGTRVHSYLEALALDPDTKLQDLFAEWDGRRGTKAHQAFVKDMGSREVLTATEFEQLREIDKTIRRKGTIQTLLNTSTHVEPGVFWQDKLTGLNCKARPDLLCDSIIVDFKTTTDLSDRGLQATILNLGYDVQAGFYIDGANAVAGGYESFVFVFLQTKAPFDARIIRLPDEWVSLGRKKYQQYITEYKSCMEEFGDAEWPGHPDYMTEIEMPTWLKQKELS